MIHVLMNQSWRYQDKLLFNVIQMAICRNIYRYVYIMGQYTHIYFLALSARGPKRNDTPVAMSTPSARILVLISFFNKRNQGSQEQWLIPGLEQEIHKVSLEHLIVSEGKEVLHVSHSGIEAN